MPSVLYERGLRGDGLWDIDNPDRVDGEGNQIHLAREAEAAIPGWMFRLCCSGDEALFVSDVELETAEKVTLDAVVEAHRNNT